MAQVVEIVPGKWRQVLAAKEIKAFTATTVSALTVPESASFALIQSISANVKWWDDGSTPTVSQGMTLVAGTVLEYRGDLRAWRGIAESGTPTVFVSYYTNNPPNAT